MPEAEHIDESVGWGLLLWRGVTRRCPRCGAGKQYKGWFRMVERCAGCGMRFEREPGFFVGAYLINFAIVIVLLFVLCMAFVAMKAIDHDASVMPVIVAGLPLALLAPVFFYPYSRTIWSAFDLGMTPLSDEERVAAEVALSAGEVGKVVAGSGGTPEQSRPGPKSSARR